MNVKKPKVFIEVTSVPEMATQVAQKNLVRLNPNMFDQYITFRLAGWKHATAGKKQIALERVQNWVSEYDQDFNRNNAA